MRRRITQIYDDRKYFSPVFAVVCAFAALALALVAFRFGTKQLAKEPAYNVDSLQDRSTFDYDHGIVVKLSDGARFLFQEQNESDVTEFTVDDFVLRAQLISPRGVGDVPVLILISKNTPAGELISTIDELKALGVQSFTIVTEETSE